MTPPVFILVLASSSLFHQEAFGKPQVKRKSHFHMVNVLTSQIPPNWENERLRVAVRRVAIF